MHRYEKSDKSFNGEDETEADAGPPTETDLLLKASADKIIQEAKEKLAALAASSNGTFA